MLLAVNRIKYIFFNDLTERINDLIAIKLSSAEILTAFKVGNTKLFQAKFIIKKHSIHLTIL